MSYWTSLKILKNMSVCVRMCSKNLSITGVYFEMCRRKSSHFGHLCAVLHSSCTLSRPVFDKTSLVWLCEQSVCGGNGCQGEWGRQQMNPWETIQRWDWKDDNLQHNSCSLFYIQTVVLSAVATCLLGSQVCMYCEECGWISGWHTHIHVQDNKLSIPSADPARLLHAPTLVQFESDRLVLGLNYIS